MKTVWIALALAGAFLGGAVAQQMNPDFRHLKPDGLFINPRYSHVIEVNRGKVVFIAGQMPVDKDGMLVGKGDFRAQAKQTYDNLMLALKSAGLDASSVVKLNMYLVDLPKNNPVNREVRSAYFPDSKPNPTATVVGVTALAPEGQMIEVEAVAIQKQWPFSRPERVRTAIPQFFGQRSRLCAGDDPDFSSLATHVYELTEARVEKRRSTVGRWLKLSM